MDTNAAADAATIPRAPGDTDRSYQALARFALLGPGRSLRALAQQGDSASVAQLFRWSAAHNWMARVRRYDAAVAAQAQQAFADEATALARQHAQEAAAVRQVALATLTALDPDTLAPAVALRAWEAAIRIERLSLGLPTDNTASKIDLTAHADVRHEVETTKRLMCDPDVRAAIATARRALSRQLQGQQGDNDSAE